MERYAKMAASQDALLIEKLEQKLGSKANASYDEEGKVSQINVVGKHVTHLPDEVWDLVSLRELRLVHMQIDEQIPLEKLPHLQAVSLLRCDLSSFPANLASLTHLEVCLIETGLRR